MKKLMALVLLLASTSFATTLSCSLDGSSYGISEVYAKSTGSAAEESIYSHVERSNEPIYDYDKSPAVSGVDFYSFGYLNKKYVDFQITETTKEGPFGIEKLFITSKDGKNFKLEIRNYCNFYYQEEKCMTGEIIEAVEMPISCALY